MTNRRRKTPGARIKRLREERELSQKEAARRARMSQAMWGQVERDESSPSVELAAAMASVLGVTRDDIWPPASVAFMPQR